MTRRKNRGVVGTCCGDKGKSANKEGRVQAKTNAGGVGVTQPQETAPVTPPGMPEKHGHRRESEQIDIHVWNLLYKTSP